MLSGGFDESFECILPASTANNNSIVWDGIDVSNWEDDFTCSPDKTRQILTFEQETGLKTLEQSAVSSSTTSQTNKWVNKFRRFLQENHAPSEFEQFDASALNDYLRLFYSELKTDNGLFYAPASLICIRAALHRHLTSPEVNKRLDILHGEDFRRANGVLKGMVKSYLTSNQEKVVPFERITDDDLIKLKRYFEESEDDMATLQNECLFNIIFYFQLRGRENLRMLTKSCIGFSGNSESRLYAYIKVPLLQKNVKASLNPKDFEDLKLARMVEQRGDKHCPVARLQLYLSKLPCTIKDDNLFPKWNTTGRAFSQTQVIGKDKLGNLMSILSKKASLSKNYTNHCIRVTGINIMHDGGMSNEAIANVTGHKNAKSVQRYIRRNEKKLTNASNILGAAMGIKRSRESSTVNSAQDCVGSENDLVFNSSCNDKSPGVTRHDASIDVENGVSAPKILNFSGNFTNCSFYLK